MASIYIQTTDFKGQTNIASDQYSESGLQTYIEDFEVRILQELLGVDLYAEFAADWNATLGEPKSAKFLVIWNALNFDYSCQIYRSQGIKQMLSFLIYWEYLRDMPVKNNIAGPQINEQANSRAAELAETNATTNYNQALESYKSIQWYVDCYNPLNYDYSEYNGQPKEYLSFI